jgi:hypothetical protein
MTEKEWMACTDPRRMLDYLAVYHLRPWRAEYGPS